MFAPQSPAADVTIQPAIPSDSVIEIGLTGTRDVILGFMTVRDHEGAESNVSVLSGSSLRLTNMAIRSGVHTSSRGGGGVFISDGGSLVTGGVSGDTVFQSNITNGVSAGPLTNGSDGGAIHAGANTTIDIDDALFTANAASGDGLFDSLGGAIFAGANSNVTISNSTFNLNLARGSGGAVYLSPGTDMTVDVGTGTGNETVFSLNNAAFLGTNGSGGAIYNSSGFLDIDAGVEFGGNLANGTGSNGGAVFLDSGSDAEFGESGGDPVIFSANRATNGGGAVFSQSSSGIEFVNVHATRNRSDGTGGFLRLANGSADIDESGCDTNDGPPDGVDSYCNLFEENVADDGGAVVHASNAQIDISQARLSENDSATTADVGAIIWIADTDGQSDLNRLVIDGHDVVTASGALLLVEGSTADSVVLSQATFTRNQGRLVDQDNSAPLTVSRLLLDVPGEDYWQGGTYSGICNVATFDADNGTVPDLTIGSTDFQTTARSTLEPADGTPAIDICKEFVASQADIYDRLIQDGDGNGIDGFDAGAFELEAILPIATCNGLTVTVDIGAGQLPTAGDDVILGTAGNDVIAAGDGDDVVCAGGGDDFVVGGPGDDLVLGGPGADELSGNAGDDTLMGQTGPDIAFGGSGTDLIDGGLGNDLNLGGGSDSDTVLGGEGDDRINGGSDGDILVSGGVGSDRVNGGGGNDGNVRGDDGDDFVSGNGGSDVVHGDDGDDEVRGGQADDTVFGGAGDDFVAGNDGIDSCDGGTTGETAGDTAAGSCETVVNVP